MGVLLKQFTAEMAEAVLEDARTRGFRCIKYLYIRVNRGVANSYKLKMEISSGRGMMLICCLRDYLHFLALIKQDNANDLIQRELWNMNKLPIIKNAKSPCMRRLQIKYLELSPDCSVTGYEFYKLIRNQEKKLRAEDVIAEGEKMPTKKTLIAWVLRWQREYHTPELLIDNHVELVKGTRSGLNSRTEKQNQAV